ncbi:MAG TPA: nucleotidyltransferase family protein [Actinomycetota bacterium]|nr:nucleotidyltransferase family protein [Actinomycetota bacterium]
MISAIVLAAGTSSRFGRTKQVVEVGGKPLAQHAVDAAHASGVDEIVVVLGHDATAVRERLHLPSTARTVVNAAYAQGQATSLAAGLAEADPHSEAAVVLMADQPGIEARHVRALVEAFTEEPTPIVRLRFRDGPGPALLARRTWPAARALRGDAGARQLIAGHPELVRELPLDEDAPPDVDTPGDLAGDAG